MSQEKIEKELAPYFPFWEKLEGKQREDICSHAVFGGYKKGTFVHNAAEECVGIILVRSGQLRVYIQSEDGRDITLYRLFAGDTCVLSASCFMEEITFDILIDAEEDSSLITVRPDIFRRLSAENIYVENYIYKQTAERFSDVMWTMQQILFMSFDKRLAVFLMDELIKTEGDTLNITHDQIAKYTGSAREVVSRMLKYFEGEGIVKVSRGKVNVLDRRKLQELTR